MGEPHARDGLQQAVLEKYGEQAPESLTERAAKRDDEFERTPVDFWKKVVLCHVLEVARQVVSLKRRLDSLEFALGLNKRVAVGNSSLRRRRSN